MGSTGMGMGRVMRKLLTVLLALSPTLAFAQAGQYTPFNPFLFNGTSVTSSVPLLLPDGTANFPSWGFTSDNDGSGTGVFRITANSFGFSSSGAEKFRISTADNYSFQQLTIYGVLTPEASGTRDLGKANPLFWRTLYLSHSIQGASLKALTESNATAFVQVAVPQTAAANYAGGEVTYTIYETDGTDSAVIEGNFKFSCVNKAGTESCAAIADVQTATIATSVNTLACTITAVTGLVDVVQFAANCTDAATLTQTILQIQYRLNMPQPNTVTPQ